MKSNYLLIYFLLISTFGFSQNIDVSGTVKEKGTNIPITGANIKIKDGQKSTTTNFDGTFVLKGVAKGETLVVSFLGFKTQEYLISDNQGNLNIYLTEDKNTLEQIVVIGYGTQKKKEVTGAVSVVDSKTIENLKPIKVEQALQGTVSGVNVTSQSGAPGAALDIRIRGIATNGQNAPTAIIDGYVGDLSLLNPSDIETITVLKDAQAAIYGTIGANGIILITTKSGKKNSKTKFSYNSYLGIQETSRKLPLLNATEYALLLNERYANGGQVLPYPNVSNLGAGTDWQEEVFSKRPIVNHDFSLSGGSEKIGYTLSASNLDQEGIVGKDKSGFVRNTARIGLNTDLSSKIKFNSNVIYTQFSRNTLNENGLGSVLFNALNVPSTLTPYDNNGDYTLVPNTTGLGNEIINPLAQISNTYNDYKYRKINGKVGLDYKVFKGFEVSSSFGFNTSNSKSKVFNKKISYGGKVFDVNRSSVTQGSVNDNNFSFDLYGTYSFSLAEEAHNFTTTFGTTVFKEYGNGLFATGFDVPNNSWEFADISLTTGISDSKPNSSYNYDERRLSYFGRLQYDFKKKYLLSFMIRRDASTKFGPNNAVAYFPSATAGWVISEEGFLKESNFLNFLKFRASYGSLGNDQIDNNLYLGVLNGEATYVFDDTLTNGTAGGIIPNPDIKWEEARKLDLGLDFEFLNKNLSLTTDYFIDDRKDLLIKNVPVSGINGTGAPGSGAPTINAGDVRNSGLEFAINYKNKASENFDFSIGYNATFLKNEVMAVNNGTGYFEKGAFGVSQPIPTRMQVGHEMGYFYGYKTAGIFQNQDEVNAHPSQIALGAVAQPGDIRYVDINNDGVINTNDRTDLGSPIPDVTMGFNIQANYIGFDISAYSFASLGNKMIRNYERNLSDANRLDYVLDRWTGEGTSNTVPRVTTAATANNVFSDFFVEDASYLRIQNVQLGYTLKQDFSEKIGITKVRIYTGVNNLYTFTKYKGYNPGASSGDPISGGIDFGFYPLPRIYMFGIHVNF
ncbi:MULTISPECIES: SusC/RagA family TonB-linked outer membrane protein [Flavobacterium]|uniref:TonB-dependent receptor n=1 Tax=Flavobacterium hankyongi TaxID=1176532 RepID=A0ABP8ZH05_9FLAO|nr:TonB-dependent receptor [Flavobacterium sp. N1846]